MSVDTHIRINKFISESGYCSRRKADQYVEEGRATINGKIAQMGDTVKAGDKVIVDGELIKHKKPTDKPIYIALNKPPGITTTTDTNDKTNIIDFINYPKRIFPIGRLDNPSEGLIFLTNNGDIINKILRAGNNHEKEYIVTVDKPITPEFIMKMSNGVRILDTVTKKCLVQHQGKNVFRIVLTQGLNRQIRRMCEVLGYKVTRLKRTRIMNVKLDNLATGAWRYLTPEEIAGIHSMVADSSNTEEASYETEKIPYKPKPAAKPKPVTTKPKTEFNNPKAASARHKSKAGASKPAGNSGRPKSGNTGKGSSSKNVGRGGSRRK